MKGILSLRWLLGHFFFVISRPSHTPLDSSRCEEEQLIIALFPNPYGLGLNARLRIGLETKELRKRCKYQCPKSLPTTYKIDSLSATQVLMSLEPLQNIFRCRTSSK